ncbi:hypothetical protein CROQUDRAFT_654241 [Cronartium quercuum f. sp. fusiforme G11]|uniref:Decapping nuclease n=1 Tax=Cronartium quercuum f. sp. fusiforme G11 TaxID=708437 RepID=A0A9P6NNP3_9BASI|nr:hypothetical protein CROQUDRAFT_654241 [Cronartium quercuum f. sp. fusiforme G11]
MPLNLAHLLNSAPVSPPRSQPIRSTNNNGPEPSRLTELLSPTAISQSLAQNPRSDDNDDQEEKSNQKEPLQDVINEEVKNEEPNLNDQVGLASQTSQSARPPRQSIGSIEVPPSCSDVPLVTTQDFLPMQPATFTLPSAVFNGVFARGTQIETPVYQRPIAMSSFSYLEGRRMAHGLRRYESLKPINLGFNCIGFDLHTGIENVTYRDVTVDEGLDGLLTCLTHCLEHCPSADRPGLLRRLAETEFVTWRGMMTKICSAVYETSPAGGWEMNAMMVDGTIYIEENVSPATIAAHVAESSNLIPSYYGHSYESLMTSPPGRFNAVDTNVQWCSVVKANLNNIKLILGGEVDCVRPEAIQKVETFPLRKFEVQPEDFIEIKTSGLITTERERWTFQRYKMLKFWLQSFLLGTPVINVGFRDKTGMVCKSESLSTHEIPALVKHEADATARWSASLCLDSGAKILKFIKDQLQPSRHHRLASFEAEFKRYCAIETEKKLRYEPFEFSLSRWQRWPVFRIMFVPAPQGGRRGGRGRIEIRELDYELEVRKEVLANRPPGGRVGFLPKQWIEHKIKQELALMEAQLKHDQQAYPSQAPP